MGALDGKVTVATGASRGVGEYIAVRSLLPEERVQPLRTCVVPVADVGGT